MRPLTEWKNVAILVLGALLIFHVVATVWVQRETSEKLARMEWYLQYTATLQQQVCRNTSTTPEARKECEW